MNIFFKCLALRLISVFFVQTYFVADEYWQSLEVAHALTFGYGYLTWEYAEGIRSYAYPAIFSVIYKILEFFCVDTAFFVVCLPRICQAFLSALADYYFVRLCFMFNMHTNAIWLSVLCDWFTFYCGSRTIINTFEANLVTFGLYVFPWSSLHPYNKSPLSGCFWFGFIVFSICFIRPTAVLIWAPLFLFWLLTCKQVQFWSLVRKLLLPFCVTSLFFIALDSVFYGQLSLTPLNFLYINIFKGIASFYGSHPFHWYFTQGLPVVLGIFILPFYKQTYSSLVSTLSGRSGHFTFIDHVNLLLIPSVFTSIILLSFVKHKEFRFLLPLLPMIKIIYIQGISSLGRGKLKKLFQCLAILGFIIPSVLFGRFHQSGSLSIMEVLRKDVMANPGNTSILILTPCHATPLYSHLHVNVPIRFITCHPPLTSHHEDESQVFFDNPLGWLQLYYISTADHRPSHVVMFDNLIKPLGEFLTLNNYNISHTLFHTLFPEGNVGKNIVIYKLIL